MMSVHDATQASTHTHTLTTQKEGIMLCQLSSLGASSDTQTKAEKSPTVSVQTDSSARGGTSTCR